MQFTRKTDYGIILVEALKPTYRSGEYLSLRAVAERYHLPYPFLEKLAGILKKGGVVAAQKGVYGGYRLIRDPKTLTLSEVIHIFGEPAMVRCIHSTRADLSCPVARFCPTRAKWRDVGKQVDAIFSKVTVDSLSSAV